MSRKNTRQEVGSIWVERFGSPIRRSYRQRAILAGLGLAGSKRRRCLKDTPEIRAMAAKIAHMVRIVEGADDGAAVSKEKVHETQ